MSDDSSPVRRRRLGRHLRHNVVSYLALIVAISLTPLPSWAAATIGTAQIKNGAVTTKKLAPNAVKPGKINAGAVTRSKIAGNAVIGSKIANGSVGSADLGSAAVTAAKLGTIVEVVANSATVANNSITGVTATCPAGSVLIGGGFDVGGNALPWRVQRNHKDGNGWRVFGTNQSGGDTFLQAKAYCLAG